MIDTGMLGKLSLVAGTALVLAGGGATTRADEVAPAVARPAAHLVAPDGRLVVEDGHLFGTVKGDTYDIVLGSERAQGQGGMGRVDVRLHPVAGGWRLDGIWNNAPLSFVVTADSIRGTASRPVSGDTRTVVSCSYDVAKMYGRSDYAGHEDCRAGTSTPVRFALPASTSLDDPNAAVLLIAYLVSPP